MTLIPTPTIEPINFSPLNKFSINIPDIFLFTDKMSLGHLIKMLLIPLDTKTFFTDREVIKFKQKCDEKVKLSPLKKIENVRFLLG